MLVLKGWWCRSSTLYLGDLIVAFPRPYKRICLALSAGLFHKPLSFHIHAPYTIGPNGSYNSRVDKTWGVQTGRAVDC